MVLAWMTGPERPVGMPNSTPLVEPERLRSGWFDGIEHRQVDYTGGAPE